MDREIRYYTVLIAYEEVFSKKARDLIESGMQPFGSVSITQNGVHTKVAQAFIKYKEP